MLVAASGESAPLLDSLVGPFDGVAPAFGGSVAADLPTAGRAAVSAWGHGRARSGIMARMPRSRSIFRWPQEEYAPSADSESNPGPGSLADYRGATRADFGAAVGQGTSEDTGAGPEAAGQVAVR